MSGISNNPAGTTEAAAARRVQALDKRIAGKSYRTIGRELDISHEQARRDVSAALEALAAIEQDKAAHLRLLEAAKLDELEEAIFPHAVSGRPDCIDRALRIMERRSKLLGLDMPTKIAPTDPDGAEAWHPAGDLPPHLQAIREALERRLA